MDDDGSKRISKFQSAFLILAGLGSITILVLDFLGKIELDIYNIIILIIFLALPFLRFIPGLFKSVKIGDLELEFKQLDQQQHFFAEIQQRLSVLEDQLALKQTGKQSADELKARFMNAANRFETASLGDRILLDQEMAFTGLQLDKTFLDEALRSDAIGMRCGALDSIGATGDVRFYEPVVNALSDRSSYVRYRAAKAIASMQNKISADQKNSVLEQLTEQRSREKNQDVKNLLQEVSRKIL